MSSQGSSYDIASTVDPRLPAFLCPRCFALLMESPGDFTNSSRARCPVCRIEFVREDERTADSLDTHSWLRQEGYNLDLGDLTLHADLATAARGNHGRYARSSPHSPPTSGREILDVLRAARHFVHVATFSLDSVGLAWLQIVSRRVPVRVLYGKRPAAFVQELLDGSGILDAHIEARHVEGLHQKLLVVDGLLAISGSANLTWHAMQALDGGREHVLVHTSVEQVVRLNNSAFAPHWGASSAVRDPIVMAEGSIPGWLALGGVAPTSTCLP